MVDKHSTSDVYLDAKNKINALMYADDLVLISRSKEGLQQQIDGLQEYCLKWKLNINIKKTKSMVFNRGNNIIKTTFKIGGCPIENVKSFTYLGFNISAKNCSFQNMTNDLSIKANRVIFAIKRKVKLSKLPMKLALRIFNSQIVPILLYGSEVWGPYMNFTYETWDKCNIERVHTQFLKQELGCAFQTSNNMVRADTGSRPLINTLIKRYITFTKSIQAKNSTLCYDAIVFETEHSESPNFWSFNQNYNLDIKDLALKCKSEVHKICDGNYDRFWSNEISKSSKAISFNNFKTNIALEPHLTLNFNLKHKIALSRFRLSNHALMIEKGRHLKIDKNERKCIFCENEIENEKHFLIICPIYSAGRKSLENICNEICTRYEHLNENQKFIYIMSNENDKIIKALGKFISNSFTIREKIITYFFDS